MNRDYTFELREVPPSAQEKINLLFKALRALLSEQYGGGITSKFSPAPKPAEQPEQWIVEYNAGTGSGWERSANKGLNGTFTSRSAAEGAIAEFLVRRSPFNNYEYRARRIDVPEPAQEWIVEYHRHSGEWVWSFEQFKDYHIFMSKAEAEKAFDKVSYPERYRAVPKPADKWMVEFNCIGEWVRSGTTLTKGVFNSKEEAEHAIGKEWNGYKYRAVPLKD